MAVTLESPAAGLHLEVARLALTTIGRDRAYLAVIQREVHAAQSGVLSPRLATLLESWGRMIGDRLRELDTEEAYLRDLCGKMGLDL